jgi:hypothetical protein
VLDGELTVRLNGRTMTLGAEESADVQAGQWHDWWNAPIGMSRDRGITPGERFAHMAETMFGLAQLGTSTRRACRTSSSWR